MNYRKIWEKTLGADETVQFEFSLGKRFLFFWMVVFVVIGLFTFFLGIGIFLIIFALFFYGFYLKTANAYAFTNKRVLVHTGWLSTHTISVDYSKITDVHVTEPFFERIITHTGNISIITAGMTVDQVRLTHVESPYEIKKQLDALKDRYGNPS